MSEVKGSDILCTVINGGEVSNHKGVNVPGVRLSLPYVSDGIREDILFGVEQGFDFLAASFVRSAKDVMEIPEHPGQSRMQHHEDLCQDRKRRGD